MKDLKDIVAKAKKEKTISIGTLKEKTLHSAIKHYLEADSSKHEILIEGYFADILKDDHIYEIQLRNFNVLRKKLTVFLKNHQVTIVYPLAKVKYLHYIDENGEIITSRKSPKSCHPLDCARELYRIKSFLNNPNLFIKLLMLEISEYRTNEKPSYKKTNKIDQVPVKLLKEINIKRLEDYFSLLPATLPLQFTSKDLKKEAHIRLKTAQIAANILSHLGVITKVGNDKKHYLYEINK